LEEQEIIGDVYTFWSYDNEVTSKFRNKRRNRCCLLIFPVVPNALFCQFPCVPAISRASSDDPNANFTSLLSAPLIRQLDCWARNRPFVRHYRPERPTCRPPAAF